MQMRIPVRWILLLILPGIGIAWFFDRMGRLELMMPVLASIFVFGLIIWLKWRLRGYAWFWLTIAVFVSLHIAMICLVPWTKKWVPATTSAGIASVDVWAMLAIISVVGHMSGSEV